MHSDSSSCSHSTPPPAPSPVPPLSHCLFSSSHATSCSQPTPPLQTPAANRLPRSCVRVFVAARVSYIHIHVCVCAKFRCSFVYEHNRDRINCKDCGGTSICQHYRKENSVQLSLLWQGVAVRCRRGRGMGGLDGILARSRTSAAGGMRRAACASSQRMRQSLSRARSARADEKRRNLFQIFCQISRWLRGNLGKR